MTPAHPGIDAPPGGNDFTLVRLRGLVTTIKLLDDLSGQTALVTGANRGIGHAIAEGLVAKGAKVFAGVRDVGAFDAPQGQVPVRLDVTDDDAIAAAVATISEETDGKLDVLVNNAGIAEGWGARLDNTPFDRIDAILQTNLRGPMRLTQLALPLLLAADHPRVVNMSSGMGAMGEGMSGGNPGYRVSKTGLNGFTVYLHSEYADRGLIANVMCPGWVHTELGGREAPRTPEEGADTAIWLASFAPGSPGGRWYRNRKEIDW